jgi:hypothetical protein
MHDCFILLGYHEMGNAAEPTFIAFFTSQGDALTALEELIGFAMGRVYRMTSIAPWLSKTFQPISAPPVPVKKAKTAVPLAIIP